MSIPSVSFVVRFLTEALHQGAQYTAAAAAHKRHLANLASLGGPNSLSNAADALHMLPITLALEKDFEERHLPECLVQKVVALTKQPTTSTVTMATNAADLIQLLDENQDAANYFKTEFLEQHVGEIVQCVLVMGSRTAATAGLERFLERLCSSLSSSSSTWSQFAQQHILRQYAARAVPPPRSASPHLTSLIARTCAPTYSSKKTSFALLPPMWHAHIIATLHVWPETDMLRFVAALIRSNNNNNINNNMNKSQLPDTT
eukprot:PhM_4_TR9445/c0_g1_i1/m.9387